MFEVTETATNQIADYFKGKDPAPIRVFLHEGGWGGPSLAMALDEPKDTDETYDIEGFQYIVNKDFMEKASPIKVDFQNIGFKITSSIDPGPGCSSCGTDTSGSSCSC